MLRKCLSEIGTKLLIQLGLIIVVVPLILGVIAPNLMKSYLMSRTELQAKQQIIIEQKTD